MLVKLFGSEDYKVGAFTITCADSIATLTGTGSLAYVVCIKLPNN